MDLPRTIAFTGLGSFVARRLVERLRAHHPEITLVGADVRRPHALEPHLRHHEVDLTHPNAGARLAEVFEKEGVEAVLHAAFRSAPTPDLELDHELETIGSLHVLNACAATRVRRLVFASTAMVYGAHPDNPGFLDESQPLRGHPYAHGVRNRVEAEALVASWRASHPETEVTVLRPCWIMGPSFFDRITRYLARQVVPTVMGYDPMFQFVHEEDALSAFAQSLLASHPGVFNVVGREVAPLGRLLRSAGKRVLPVPAPLLYRLGYVPSQAQSGDPASAFYDYLRYGWVAAGERGWAEFGEPLYTTREAWIAFVGAQRMRRYR